MSTANVDVNDTSPAAGDVKLGPGAGPDGELARLKMRQLSQLKAERGNFDALYTDIAKYMLQRSIDFNTKLTAGSKTTTELYDSTALVESGRMARALHGNLTSSFIPWLRLRFRDDKLNEVQEVKEWLQTVSKAMLDALSDSNFDAAMPELYHAIITLCTSGILVEENKPDIMPATRRGERFRGLMFKTLPLSRIWIDEAASGRVNRIFIEMTMSAQAAVDRWGAKVGDRIMRDYKQRPSKTVDIVRVIEPRNGAKEVPLGRRAAMGRRPYPSYWIEPRGKTLITEDSYYEFPVMVGRWERSAGEVYGRGPGFDALPDTRTLNKAKELGLKAWAKVLDPPLKRVRKATLTRVKTYPGAVNDVRNHNDLTTLYEPNAFRFDVSQIKEQELKNNIRAAFFTDRLSLPPVPESKTMSATEVEVRYEEMQKLLGPALGRLIYEVLNPLVDRVFAIMLRAGQFPPIPQAVVAATGGKIDVEYLSPLVRAQRSADIVATQRAIGDAYSLAELGLTDVVDNIDPDATWKVITDRYGTPASVTRPETSRDEVRQNRAELQQQQLQLGVAGAQAEIAATQRKR